jgi:hypothetical protein
MLGLDFDQQSFGKHQRVLAVKGIHESRVAGGGAPSYPVAGTLSFLPE